MEESSKDSKRKRLDFATTVERFKERGASDNCPVCHHQEWSIHNTPGVPGVALPWGDGTGGYFMAGLPVIVVICKNCGFIRLHDPAMLGEGIIKEGEE